MAYTVVSFESRMADETGNLIEKCGGRVISAPSMQEIPLERQDSVFVFAERLLRGGIDVLICLTGVGTSMLIDAMLTRYPRDEVVGSLSRVTIVARGPKPIRALKAYGLTAGLKVPEPNTWRQLLETLDGALDVASRQVAVQEYGRSNDELLKGLESRGAIVLRVPVYAWALPDDIDPLLAGIDALISGAAQVAMFTSRTQVDHVFQVADSLGLAATLRRSLSDRLVASIGPVCSEGLNEYGIRVDIEPEHPKLGFLVKAIAERVQRLGVGG